MFADPMAWTIEHGYPVLFGMLLFSGLGVPIPEDVPLIAAGVLATQGGMGVIQASITCSFFVLCRDLAVFTLGYRFGDALLEGRWGRRIIRAADLQRAETRLRQRGTAVIFIGRFLPGLRAERHHRRMRRVSGWQQRQRRVQRAVRGVGELPVAHVRGHGRVQRPRLTRHRRGLPRRTRDGRGVDERAHVQGPPAVRAARRRRRRRRGGRCRCAAFAVVRVVRG